MDNTADAVAGGHDVESTTAMQSVVVTSSSKPPTGNNAKRQRNMSVFDWSNKQLPGLDNGHWGVVLSHVVSHNITSVVFGALAVLPSILVCFIYTEVAIKPCVLQWAAVGIDILSTNPIISGECVPKLHD